MLSGPDFQTSVYATLFYHFCTLLVGITLCYMGYRLFTLGISEAAGDAQGKWGKNSIVIKRAAPGTFFGVFGAIVIVVALVHGIGINVKTSTTESSTLLNSMRQPDSGDAVRSIMLHVALQQPISDDDRAVLKKWLQDESLSDSRYNFHSKQDDPKNTKQQGQEIKMNGRNPN
jgi:hypothetical protein